MLTGATRGKAIDWTEVVGEVFVVPLATNPRSNWTVLPTGGASAVAAVEKSVEFVRQEYPHARPSEAPSDSGNVLGFP